MSGFSPFELQKAIYQALTGDATLMGMIGGVYDRVTEGSAFPYITIGESVGREWSTPAYNGMNLTLGIHVFSRNGGRKEALQIMERVHTLLHEGNLSMTGHILVMMRFQVSDILLEQDGLTYQGTLKFQAITEAA